MLPAEKGCGGLKGDKMRIADGNATKQIGKSRAKARSSGASGAFALPEETSPSTSSQATVQSPALQDVSSLLALQSVEDPMHGKRRKAVRRGNRMLDLLEQVRMGLLGGSMSVPVLQQLEQLAQAHEPSGDARIDELLLDIGLRAQVELAKLENLRVRQG